MKLWLHQNKAKFAGLQRVRFISQLTILEHNLGNKSNSFIDYKGFSSTPQARITRTEMDKARTSYHSEKRRTETKTPESTDC